MERKTAFSVPAVGGSSLLTIFAVLCLSVFALLSLSTVRAEQRLADTSAAAVSAYYEADCRAEEIFAKLRQGEAVPGVRKENQTYSYSCPISENQTLEVSLQYEQGTWEVLRWQAVAAEQTGRETIPVWDGEGGTP